MRKPREGMYINVDVNVSIMIESFLPLEIDVMIHTETGALGCFGIAEPEECEKRSNQCGSCVSLPHNCDSRCFFF